MTSKGVCLDIPSLIEAAKLGHIEICDVCKKYVRPCYKRVEPKYNYLGMPLITCENAPDGINLAPAASKPEEPAE